MKQLLMFLFVSIFSIAISAQGNSQRKSNGNEKSTTTTSTDQSKEKENDNKDVKDRADHERKIWEGTYAKTSEGPKPSKNQPAKVRVTFYRDYPNATNVSWSKYRGDWTASFRNGIGMSTAVYHANGDRRDTRTPIIKENIPKKIFDIITKKPDAQMDGVIKIEVPKVIKDIFRIKTVVDGKPQYVYYNDDGLSVQYNY